MDLLAAIRALAVREENPKVARVALSRMVQDRGEPIRSFAARLRGQAEVCMFTLTCPGCARINNQGEQRVADQLCIGLADPEIQEDLLKDPNQAMSVEETIRFVEVRAAGKRSAITITTPASSNAIDEGGTRGRHSTAATGRSHAHQCHAHQLRPPPRTGASPPTTRGSPPPTKGKPVLPGSQPIPRLPAASAAVQATANVPGRPYDGCSARPSARRAQHATGRTITQPCAGRSQSRRMPSGSPCQTCQRAHSRTRHGTPPPAHGSSDGPHLSQTWTCLYRHTGRTTRPTDTPSAERRGTWPPLPWPTQDARAAWQARLYRRDWA